MSAGRVARRTLVVLGVIAAAAAAGYVVTCAIFPAPMIAREIAVPALHGAAAEAAVAELGKAGLRVRLADTVPDPLTPAGTVSWQSPVAETVLPQGAIVKLGISSGAPLVSVPSVADLDIGLAREVIEAAGLRVARVDTARTDAEFGTVVSTVPPAGTAARSGDTVRVTISSGPASVAVPDLTGLTLAAARDRLDAAWLRVGTVDQRLEGKAGTVLAQRPAPGELVTRESAVDLTVTGTTP
ncbi:MAG: PASTA domain-containing protein [Gemmatimonadales bacterium]